jgi:hypothetical protein
MIQLLRLLPILLLTSLALADGGVVRTSQQLGPWMITVFSSPTPFRVGPVDLSVLVQDAETSDTVFDVDVNLMLRHAAADAILVEATREAATNQLLRAALFDLPAPGTWQVDVSITSQEHAERLQFALDADPPLPRLMELWIWLSIPILALVFFVLHQWLVRSRRPRTAAPEPMDT